ncbi:MAG TPA: SBBP repeat-containing protein [Anaerolineales bacterium]|nr:SBBP repeat-containing protein [Anaerolineales bacterium]
MFAKLLRKEIVIRVLLIAVILINATIPTMALAMPLVNDLENQNAGGGEETSTNIPVENNYQQANLERPVTKQVTRSDQPLKTQGIIHDATITCDEGTCSDPGPDVVLTEVVVDTSSMGWHSFRIQCPSSPCASRDIYWHVSMDFTFGNTNPTIYVVPFKANIFGGSASTPSWGEGSGGIHDFYCGDAVFNAPPGTCHLEAGGVIQKEIIAGNPNMLWYDHFFVEAKVGSGVALTWATRTGTIQVSYDPSLLDSNIPWESINCKGGCYYGQATGFAADPINTSTGAVSYNVNDLEIPTSAGPLSLKHTYVSSYVDRFTSPLGYGWVHNQDLRLLFPGENEPGYVHFKDQSGNLYRFWYAVDPNTGVERFTPYAGYTASLVKNSGTPPTYTLTDQSQNIYEFDQDGKVTSFVNATGQAFMYTYDQNGMLDQVSADGNTKYLEFHYDPQQTDRLESVNDHTTNPGRSVSFDYDVNNGDLTSYTDVLGQTWTYKYDDQNNDHLLTEIEDPDDNLVERNVYYPDGRTWKQFNGEDKLVAELIYNLDGTTTVRDVLGKDITHTYDSRGTLTGDANYFGETQKTFDGNFRTDSIQTAVGIANEYAPTILDWSDDGANLDFIQDPLGYITTIDYTNPNSPNVPTKITDPNGFDIIYYYDDPNFPNLPTRIEPQLLLNSVFVNSIDYEYYPPSSGAYAGKIKQETDTLGNATFYTYYPSGQIESVTTAYGGTPNALTTTYAYDPLGHLEDVTDPAGIVNHNEYDNAGRLTKTIRNVHPTVTTQNYQDKYNITTRYFYDSRGNQIAVADTDWVVTRTYYDFANRPVGFVQNLVINNSPANNDADVIAAISIPEVSLPSFDPSYPDRNIHSSTVYDDAGNVIETIDPVGIVTKTEYDEANRPSLTIQNFVDPGIYDPAYPDQNIRTEYKYDANGNVIAVIDTLGIVTRTYYDALNRPISVVQHLTGQSYLSETIPPRGGDSNIRTDMAYDPNGNVIATTDPKEVTTRTYYDALNRPEMVVQNWSGVARPVRPPQQGQVLCGSEVDICTETYYDEAGNVEFTVDPRGYVTQTEYDEANRPFRITQNPGGAIGETLQTTIAYDQFGRRDTVTDSENHVTKYIYNEVGQLSQVIVNYVNGGSPQSDDNQWNIVTAYEYDELGRQVKTTDTLGRESVTVYDGLGRVLNVTQNNLDGQTQNYENSFGDHFNIKTTYTYDERGSQIAVKDTKNIVTRTYYDALGRSTAVVRNFTGTISDPTPPVRVNPIDPVANLQTNTIYLGNGNVDYLLDELGQVTDYDYDDLGRLILVLDSLSNPTSYKYDANGNRTMMTDAEGISTKYEYDNLNRLKTVYENFVIPAAPDKQTHVRTEYTYDASGNRLSIRDGQSFLDGVAYYTTFTYDPLGHLKTETDPLGNGYTYYYDAGGNRSSVYDANEQTTTFEYDELNRLKLIDYQSPDADVTFDYDALGRRTKMVDGLGETTWDLNNIDQPNTINDPFSAQVAYQYDEVGNRDKLTYPDGTVVDYVYNDAYRLETVTATGVGSTDYGYDAAGRLKNVARPNGVDSVYNYLDNGWLQGITHSSGAQTLASYQYQYYPDGNRNQVIENVLNPQQQASLPQGASFSFTNQSSVIPVSWNVPGDMAYQKNLPSKSLYSMAPQQVNFGQLPLYFVPNLGQFDKDVQFQTNALGGSIFFTQSEVVLALMDKKIKLKNEENDTETPSVDNSKVVRIEYKGADKKPLVEGVDLLPGTANFMVGSDESKWVSNAPMYAGVVYRELYSGIDLRYEGNGRSLKSTFTVAAGADPSEIQWRYKEAGDITLNESGDLLITLPAKKSEQSDTILTEHAPIAWQDVDGQHVDVPVEYVLANNGEISFVFPGGYDTSLPLIIDPTLTYSTYLGDIGTDVGTAITTDSSGNVYITGYSYCWNFPTVDPITGETDGSAEAIISKISADGSTLLYSTCVGGAGDDFGKSIDLDSQGRIVVAGETDSTDFPIVSGIATYGGNTGICSSGAPCQDTFILALNSDGSAIRYSTYLGGDGREEVGGVAVDGDDNVIVVGSTTSTDYPTQNAYDASFGGGSCSSSNPCYDVTVTKVDPDLSGTSAILYSTYLGSNKHDKGYGLVLDSNGLIYLAGKSDANGYPTRNALQSSRSGSLDIIITQIDPTQVGDASLIYSTYLGSTGAESGYAIARDVDGNLYITGRTSSSKFPLRDPLQYESHPGTCDTNCYEAFVTKVDITTNTILYSTYLGGSENDEGFGIVVDSSGRAYVTGFTHSSNFPTHEAIQPTKGGDGCNDIPCMDAFLSVIEPDGQSFAYSTFLGGDQDDEAKGITLDSANNVYLVGETYSTNYPTTAGAYDVVNTETNKRDAFITKIGALSPTSPPTTVHFDIPIATGDDDAEEKGSGYVSLDSSDLELVYDGSNQHVGLRFMGVDIPQGATITAAWIQFTVNEATSDTTSLTVQAQAADDPSTFTSSSGNISSRPRTSASVPLIPPVWDTVDVGGPDQRTPDLASVVQEVVDRQGWAEGNAMVFIITGTGERVAKSYERDVYGAPYLHIEYSTSASPTGELGLQISASPTTFTDAGESISYTYTLTNTGTVPLNGAYTVTDDTVALVDCSAAQSLLAEGQSTTCTGSYTTTVADVTAGSIVNSAIATASDGTQTVISDSATETVTYQPPPPTGPVTINYVYDDLNRLTEANYDNGNYYHYAYDAVGNRETQDAFLSGLLTSTSYYYDNANRLIDVNGVPYTWDDNGNLKNDGLNDYDYDSANRLKTFTNATTTVTYAYNGLGDRLQETMNGNTTTFTMDLNMGLTQALSDGTNTYIYGAGRIAQVNTGTEYFLGDALGSVRQLTNASGAITYARAYDPYGVVTSTGGSSQSAYGYTNEYTSQGLIYLRSRTYSPADGRFLTKDSWMGDYNRPLSLNRWAYVEGNPVNYTDPSGRFPTIVCQFMPTKAAYELCIDYNYDIEPLYYSELGEHVEGGIGCYTGPTQYRAPGYIEGLGLTLTPTVVNWLFAFESVYDFATMEQQFFINDFVPGLGLSDSIWGIAVSPYAGTVYGLKTDSTISDDYPGPVFEYVKGISLPPGLEIVGAGRTRFVSPKDIRIRGESWYISGGFTIDLLPVGDIGGGYLSLAPITVRKSYLIPGKPNDVDEFRLFSDILLGKNSAWPIISNPFNGNVPLDWGARFYGAYQAMKYALVYEELHQ